MKHVIKHVIGICHWTFGHIELNVSIIHPSFINDIVVNILKIFCWKCNEFLLTKDHLEIKQIFLNLKRKKKFNAVLEK